ncbi:MAG: glycoside hydrolase family 3 N-terminal domain-containing protein [Candidatus Babeliales bacterium]
MNSPSLKYVAIYLIPIATFLLKCQNPPFLAKNNTQNSQNILTQLTVEQKIGQLFMVAAVADEQKSKSIMQRKPYRMDQEYVEKLIQDYHIGGLIFFGTSTPTKQKKVTEHFQHLSKIPLLIGQDLEWGLAMRLQQVTKLPYAMTLGAIADDNLIYELGKEIGNQCKAIGVHINFAPVADINTNPLNPIINCRSFGQDKNKVSSKAIAFMKGLQDAGIIACAKHFPGHGDTNVDSHEDLLSILHNKKRLYTTELYPFKELINQGVSAIMVAHLLVPSFDKHNPTSLSPTIVTHLLKKELNFSGLIITDALDMKGVTKNHRDGEIALHALLAGNDILLCPQNVLIAVEKIKKALASGELTMQELDEHVQKILQLKQWLKNHAIADRDPTQLNTSYTIELKKKLYEQAVTVAKNTKQLIPLKNNVQSPIQLIQIGSKQQEPFVKQLTQQQQITLHTICHNEPENNIIQLCQDLNNKETIIISIHWMSQSIQNSYGITDITKKLINNLSKKNKKIILVIFGNPYSIQFFKNISTIIFAYENEPEAQIAASNIILGNLKSVGVLPVKITV